LAIPRLMPLVPPEIKAVLFLMSKI